eukprot:Em0004g350a
MNCTAATDVASLPAHLRLLLWSCKENCAYECMHEVTAQDLQSGRKIRQFYGKWPFVRILGVQEPSSALFSVLNGVANAYGYLSFKRRCPSNYPYLVPITVQCLVSLHTWFWSTVFHCRDTYWTERLDYFCASAMIVSGLVLQFIRITGPSATLWHCLYILLWAVLFLAHVSYLTLYKFDYGYNMAASILAGALYTAIWLLWCWRHWAKRRYLWKCCAVVLGTTSLLLLELLDFPPLWWAFDAHSLWHLFTAPLPLLWYSFLLDDANYEIRGPKKSV